MSVRVDLISFSMPSPRGLITLDYKISRMEDQKKRGAACLVAGNQA